MKKMTFAAFAALLPLAALADGPISVEDSYARSANPKSGAAFMMLTNGGDMECTLIGATTDAAEKTELHTHREENGMMVMGPADPIVLAPGATHHLDRGGDHVMLMGLKKPLENGDEVVLQLDFGPCGMMEIQVPVDNDRAAAASDHDDHGDHGAAAPEADDAHAAH